MVIWCATSDLNETTEVGWYKHATVYRTYQSITFNFDDSIQEERWYNVLVEAKDCVLLPARTRHRHIWNAPSAKKTRSFGFGQALVWYPIDSVGSYIAQLIENINNYPGENWLNKYPNEKKEYPSCNSDGSTILKMREIK
ncbi:MAG: hypothetical protein WA125_13790 [Desulfosporosinus sp.]